MKNLLSRPVWDYLVGAAVGVTLAVVALLVSGFVFEAFLQTGVGAPLLGGRLIAIGMLILLSVALVVTLYEALLNARAAGKMAEPGSTEARLLGREVLIRAAISGAWGGLYTGAVLVVFALLAPGAADLNVLGVFVFGLLPSIFLITAAALSYAYIGPAIREQVRELNALECGLLLALPLILSVVLGFLFGAAAGSWAGVFRALIGAALVCVVAQRLGKLRWLVLRRAFEASLRARGGPTIRVVSTHTT